MTALAFWCVGGLLLSGSAAFLFSAVLHRFGTDGWFTSTLGALGLGVSGSAMVGIGCWLTYLAWSPSHDEVLIGDDAMWFV